MKLIDQFAAELPGLFARLYGGIEGAAIDLESIFREFYLVLPDLVLLAQQTGGPGPEKKAAVSEAIDRWYAAVIKPKELAGPDAVMDRVYLAAIKTVSGTAIDLTVAVMRRFGHLKDVAP